MSSRLRVVLRSLVPVTILLPLATTGCGVKGPPHPPLPRSPEPVHGLDLRQTGDTFELRWSAPTRREDGEPIGGPLTYLVLARVGERPQGSPAEVGAPASGAVLTGTAVPGAPSATTGSNPGLVPAGSIAPAGAGTVAPGVAPPGPPPVATPPAAGGGALVAAPARTSILNQRQQAETMSHLAEEAFVRSAAVVARIDGSAAAGAAPSSAATGEPGAEAPPRREGGSGGGVPGGAGGGGQPSSGARGPGPRPGTGAGASGATRLTARIGPRSFPGARLASARVAFAVLAIDARSRRSPARPILEIDPIAPLPAPGSVAAAGTPEGVLLSWTPPAGGAGLAGPATLPVDVYRTTAGQETPLTPIPGSPFPGPTALDRGARIGESYTYAVSYVVVDSGKGRREGTASEPVRIDYLDRFPPGPPVLVTAERIAPGSEGATSEGIRISWSSPIDNDVAGYRIYRAEAGAEFALVGTAGVEATSWVDASGATGRLRYCVTAFDGATPPNESPRSEIVEPPAAGDGGSEPSVSGPPGGSR